MELQPINVKAPGDCGYAAFWREREVALYAPSMLAARDAAAAHFKARKAYEVRVFLCERADGSTVLQSTQV